MCGDVESGSMWRLAAHLFARQECMIFPPRCFSLGVASLAEQVADRFGSSKAEPSCQPLGARLVLNTLKLNSVGASVNRERGSGFCLSRSPACLPHRF